MDTGSAPVRRVRVGVIAAKAIGWISLVFFLAVGIAAASAKQYGPMSIFLLFFVMSCYILVTAGHYELDEDGISHINLVGHYRILWSEVQRIEVGGKGAMVLYGEGKRFAVLAPGAWSGADKRSAANLFDRKIRGLPFSNKLYSLAPYQTHKNVKVVAR